MIDTSQMNCDGPLRLLSKSEYAVLLEVFLRTGYKPLEAIVKMLDGWQVQLMRGGMGSIKVVGGDAPLVGITRAPIADFEFEDVDGVLVFLSPFADTSGKIIDIDVWKQDYSDLKKWPLPENIRPSQFSKDETGRTDHPYWKHRP